MITPDLSTITPDHATLAPELLTFVNSSKDPKYLTQQLLLALNHVNKKVSTPKSVCDRILRGVHNYKLKKHKPVDCWRPLKMCNTTSAIECFKQTQKQDTDLKIQTIKGQIVQYLKDNIPHGGFEEFCKKNLNDDIRNIRKYKQWYRVNIKDYAAYSNIYVIQVRYLPTRTSLGFL